MHDLTLQVRERLSAGDLDAAIRAVEARIAESGDDALVRAAAGTADLDWLAITTAAIEADHRLRGMGEVGCRLVSLELGALASRRLDVVRHYYGAPPVPGEPPTKRAPGRLGAWFGLIRDPLRVTGIEDLAAVQLRPWSPGDGPLHQASRSLAGHLVVLRFFDAVRRHAQGDGLPVPARLRADVAVYSGEDGIGQLDPVLELELGCEVRPVGPDLEERLRARHHALVTEWHTTTEKVIRHLREHYAAHGYAPSRVLPDNLGEVKRRLADIEQRLLIHDPAHRMTPRGLEALLVQVRQARDATVPRAIDTAPYR